jgi:hypothetical protein
MVVLDRYLRVEVHCDVWYKPRFGGLMETMDSSWIVLAFFSIVEFGVFISKLSVLFDSVSGLSSLCSEMVKDPMYSMVTQSRWYIGM